MTQSKEIRWIRLGDFIHQLDERNKDRVYTLDDLRGLSIQKVFIHTKAKMDGVSLTAYKLVPPKAFCYVTITSRNSDKITLALNETDNTYIVSSSYIVFYSLHKKKLLPEYLYLWFNMPEFDRYARFNSWGSARESFSWQSMQLIQVPVPYKNGEPDIERQQEIVNIWQGLRCLKEENEAIAQPLLDICQSKMDELKHSAPMVALGEYIEQTNILNSNVGLGKDSVMGMTITKEVIPTKAKISDTDISKFKVVYPGQFIYNPRTHGAKIGLGLNQNSTPFLISWNNISFKIIDNNSFDPTYLYLWFCRSEWDREACFRSWGSSTEVFAWKEFVTMKVPKPSIEVQRAIVGIYHCARRAKKIAEEATQQLKSICPALMQHIIHS